MQALLDWLTALFLPYSGMPAAAGLEEPVVEDVDLHSQSSGVSYSNVAGQSGIFLKVKISKFPNNQSQYLFHHPL